MSDAVTLHVQHALLDMSMATLIHPTAVIHPGAELHPTVRVGAYAVIGERVTVGQDTTIGSHVVLDGWTEIGARNQIYPGAAIGLEPQDLKYQGSETQVRIGDDNCIREYVTINRATFPGEVTAIGNHNLLMAYVHIAHNCVIEDHVVITNSVLMGGHVHVESYARIGGGVGIHQFVHIGTLSMLGGMSRITRDVPPYMLVEGNPARVRSLNLVGLKRAGLAGTTGSSLDTIKRAFRLLYRSGLTFDEAMEKLSLLLDDAQVLHLYRFLQASQTQGRRKVTAGKKTAGADDED
jgi:UDP-N-acetylglucosamine acyltransferase